MTINTSSAAQGAVRFRAALVFLTLAAFALRVYGLGRQSFWLDEVDAITLAGEPVGAQLRKLGSIGENGPLYFLLFKGWIGLAGTSEFGARYLSALASTAAVPLIGALAYRLFRSAPAAVVAAVLAAASPYYVRYGQDAKMYALFALLAMLAQYCLLRGWLAPAASPPASGRGRAKQAAWWIGYLMSTSLALYVHLFAALQIAANTLAGLALWRSHSLGRRGFAVATALLLVPYVPLAVWQWPLLVRGGDVGFRPITLKDMVVTLLEQLTWHVNPPPNRALLLTLVALLVFGAYRAGTDAPALDGPARTTVMPIGTRRDRGTRVMTLIILSIWLVVPVALTFGVQGRVPVFRDRYLIPLVAPLLLLCAAAVSPPWGWLGAVSGAAAAFLALGFGYGLAHRPLNPDFRAAAALVRAEAAPDDQVGFLAQYAERPFEFYYRQGPGQYVKVTLPYTNYPTMDERTGMLLVAASLRGGQRLWVVRFEDWLWDSRDLTGRFLGDRGARAVLRRDFGGVSVTRYELPG